MRSLLCLLGAAMLVTACSTTAPAPPPSSAAVSGAPMPVDGLDWFLTEEPDETRLAYGVANSGDFRMALTCNPRSGRLDLILAAEDAATVMVLESGGEMERLMATAEPAGVMDGILLLASTDPSVPVLRRFRTLGWLAVWQGDHREMLTAHATSRPSIDRFFVVCS